MWWKVSMHLTSMLFLMISFLVSGIYAVLKLYSNMIEVVEWEILKLNSCSVVFTLIFDWISLLFLCFVFLISSSVLYYSGSYMMGDKNFNRFMYLVLMFVFSMAAMVLSPNLISILLGWDGLGLVSYVLVIYYQNEKSANAGMLTILSNRVGDVAILLSIGLMVKLGGWNFLYYVYNMEDGKWLGFKFLIILAVMTKSAQIPFSAWLPAAMAAPTPVSALVHSSTLVTAGVYLMIRFSPVLSSYTQSSLLIISCLTMFMAGLGANFEYDLKKIIALSTLSQLGVMLSILALGFSDLAFFHLLSHALFKALLFMCAGVFIHSSGEYQDIRYMGCLVKFMPYSVIYMSICNFALCGFPFLAGFYSKDMILEIALMSWVNLICLWMYILATGLTVAYTMRLVFYSMSGEFNLSVVSNSKDISNLMTDSMILLGLGAIMGGAGLSWLLFPEPYMICMSGIMKSLIMTVSIIGGFIGYICNLLNVNYSLISMKNYFWIVFMGSMWFMPFLSSVKNSDFIMKTSILMEKTGEKGWLEELGPQGLYWKFTYMFMGLNELQMNNVKIFMKMFVLSMLIMLFMII
uniref:NADH dehydrogenase subunit 5 n=1 Tax=Huananpotamon koatenense TaxID=1775324 RepID=UPI0023AA70C8|nr:NADH dehydrogenase subunit 5 [Huananpotamon koatenense]WCL18752.1 NADH dehydrogenase subunit 5 [Huananpotamon koatenense]